MAEQRTVMNIWPDQAGTLRAKIVEPEKVKELEETKASPTYDAKIVTCVLTKVLSC